MGINCHRLTTAGAKSQPLIGMPILGASICAYFMGTPFVRQKDCPAVSHNHNYPYHANHFAMRTPNRHLSREYNRHQLCKARNSRVLPARCGVIARTVLWTQRDLSAIKSMPQHESRRVSARVAETLTRGAIPVRVGRCRLK